MPCARCGAEPEADLMRYAEIDGEDEISSFLLCPGCSYGFNTLMAAYVANQLQAPAPA